MTAPNGTTGTAGGHNSGPGVRLGHSEVREPQKMGVCIWEHCPRNCNLSHVDQRFESIWASFGIFWPTVGPRG